MKHTVLAPVSRRNLAETVCQQLRQAIITGEVPQGEQLSEPELAARLHVSRAPVREALIALDREGLVEFDARGRTRVRSLAEKDFEEICSLRAVLESLAGRLAAQNWNAEHTAATEENLRQQEEAPTLGELSRLDVELHEYIVRVAGHGRLLVAWQNIRPQFEMWLAHTHRLQEKLSYEPRRITVDAHRRLLQVIAEGTPGAAAVAMAAHAESWREWLPKHFPATTTQTDSVTAAK